MGVCAHARSSVALFVLSLLVAPAFVMGDVIDVAMAVSEKLTASRAAHLTYRQAMVDKQPIAAKLALETAYALRCEAMDLDPDRLAPAWGVEQSHTPNHLDTHDSLMAFYAKALGR